MVKYSKAHSLLPITEKTGFSGTFIFFSKITFWKKKTLTSLVDYSTLFSLTEITFQNKSKYSTQYKYSTLQLEYFLWHNFTNALGLNAYFLASWEAWCS